jgi:glycerol-3-phosphate dehydrogenase
VHRLARNLGVETPITDQVYSVLFRRKAPRRAVTDLMLRRPRNEAEEYR